MVRATVRKRKRRQVSRRKRFVPPESLKKAGLDPTNEISASNFAQNRQYTILARKGDGLEKFFLSEQNYKMNELAQNNFRDRYIAGLAVLAYNNNEIAKGVWFFGLAAALARHDYELSQTLFNCRTFVTPKVVLKAVSTLDLGRRIRAIEKRVKKLQHIGVRVAKSQIPNEKDLKRLNKVKPATGTASGAVCKQLKRWTRTLTEEELRDFVRDDKAHAEKSSSITWKLIADVCHFNPEKDFPNLPWFLRYCYGDEPPEGDLPVPEADPKTESNSKKRRRTYSAMEEEDGEGEGLRALNINERVLEADIPFSAINKARLVLCLNTKSKAHLATYTPLPELLEHFKDILCVETDLVISERLLAEGDALFVEDDGPKFMPILDLMVNVLQVVTNTKAEDSMMFIMNEVQEFVETEKEMDVNLGGKTVTALQTVLERRLVAVRNRIGNRYEQQYAIVIVDAMDKHSRVESPLFVLVGTTLARLLSADLWMGNHMGPAPSPEQVTELAKSSCQKEGFNMCLVRKRLEQLLEEQRVVPIIALVLHDQTSYGDDAETDVKEIVEIAKKYSKEVHPSLFLIITYVDFNHHALVRNIGKTDLNYLVYEAYKYRLQPEETLDMITKLMGSSVTSLKSYEGQTEDVIAAMKRDGVRQTFKAMVD